MSIAGGAINDVDTLRAKRAKFLAHDEVKTGGGQINRRWYDCLAIQL